MLRQLYKTSRQGLRILNRSELGLYGCHDTRKFFHTLPDESHLNFKFKDGIPAQ